MAEYTQGLYIDGVFYDIPLAEIKRSFDFLEKYANRSEDGDMHMETIGGYQNYTCKIGTINDKQLYKRLYDHITDVVNRFHKVLLPDNDAPFEFYGYFSSIKDEITKVYDSGVQYDGLSFKMTQKKPTRRGA